MTALLSFLIVFVLGPLPILIILWHQVTDVIRHRGR